MKKEKKIEPQDYTEAWAGTFDALSESIADREKQERKMAGQRRSARNAALIRKHTRRKWCAICNTGAAVILAAAVHGFAMIGVMPAILGAAALFVIAGYTALQGVTVLREVQWYARNMR